MQRTPHLKQNPDYRPLLNRQSLQKLFRAGEGDLAGGLNDIHAVRRFALWCNQSGAEMNLFHLLLAASRQIASLQLDRLQADFVHDGLNINNTKHVLPEFEKTCSVFLECFPQKNLSPLQKALNKNIPRQVYIEMLVLNSAIENPAASSFKHLFDDAELSGICPYRGLLDNVDACLNRNQDGVSEASSLVQLMLSPVRSAPKSLLEQVRFIEHHWANWLPPVLLQKIQLAKALYEEENTLRLPGPGPAPMSHFRIDHDSNAPAAFTDDTDWMSSAVMLAKSVYVWLDQLSIRYRRDITTLADIPEEELAALSRQGFNALWLIGIWERSRASRKIKHLCGNPEAEASAYALHAYRITAELGGEEALAKLQSRCQQHGIRLACDVVPNHTGIDSEWLLQHPDWFIQSPYPPFPAYRFSGPDLSDNEQISIKIEDGYWDHSDAAVVCEYHDHFSGQRRYIYHGNDGTHMPWNDTAQLNFLLPEVRRAMSDLIIDVAKKFSLIRFDAAMTLARKHFRRLWFPPPGGAGVPSRAEFWMSDEDFTKAFPVEFWREVVDRINKEAPDTLLIAEAFWLMESYFVRNLGMHRVYNSAFMNMLKQEENAKYRKILKDILAYNPEILKRYVNFMNNPDEATAVEQFGKGDKYFGVATLLATLPGLPMFGHGQVEGYREKYGMEYRRAYWGEQPDEGFISHHGRQIFPLLRGRHDFAGVENFSLYDFTTDYGICEDVYCFSNGPGGRKHLVVYNNAPHPVSGRIHRAAPKASPQQEGVAHPMPLLWQALELDPGHGNFCRFRNLQGEEYLVPLNTLTAGLELSLAGYQHQVFSEFRVITDNDGLWQQLYNQLAGKPSKSLDRQKQRLLYKDLWAAFTKLMDFNRLQVLAGALSSSPPQAKVINLQNDLRADFDLMMESMADAGLVNQSETANADDIDFFRVLPTWLTELPTQGFPEQLLADVWFGHRNHPALGAVILAWQVLKSLCKRADNLNAYDFRSFINKIGLDYAWREHVSNKEKERAISLAMLLLRTAESNPATDDELFAELCTDTANKELLGINEHAGDRWFNREGMISVAGAVALQAAVLGLEKNLASIDKAAFSEIAEKLRQRLARATAVGFKLDKFISLG